MAEILNHFTPKVKKSVAEASSMRLNKLTSIIKIFANVTTCGATDIPKA